MGLGPEQLAWASHALVGLSMVRQGMAGLMRVGLGSLYVWAVLHDHRL